MSNNTHIPNGKKQHKDFNAIKHHRISIHSGPLSALFVSTPLRVNTTSSQQKKKHTSFQNPKTTFC
jgi:hypothetical protein